MAIDHLLQLQEKYNIQVFDKKQDFNQLKMTHACFTGSPRKHPDHEDMIILVTDLFGTQPTYFEFKLKDISSVERLSNEVNMAGETATTVRIWVKKGSVGIRCIPFVVEDIHVSNLL